VRKVANWYVYQVIMVSGYHQYVTPQLQAAIVGKLEPDWHASTPNLHVDISLGCVRFCRRLCMTNPDLMALFFKCDLVMNLVAALCGSLQHLCISYGTVQHDAPTLKKLTAEVLMLFLFLSSSPAFYDEANFRANIAGLSEDLVRLFYLVAEEGTGSGGAFDIRTDSDCGIICMALQIIANWIHQTTTNSELSQAVISALSSSAQSIPIEDLLITMISEIFELPGPANTVNADVALPTQAMKFAAQWQRSGIELCDLQRIHLRARRLSCSILCWIELNTSSASMESVHHLLSSIFNNGMSLLAIDSFPKKSSKKREMSLSELEVLKGLVPDFHAMIHCILVSTWLALEHSSTNLQEPLSPQDSVMLLTLCDVKDKAVSVNAARVLQSAAKFHTGNLDVFVSESAVRKILEMCEMNWLQVRLCGVGILVTAARHASDAEKRRLLAGGIVLRHLGDLVLNHKGHVLKMNAATAIMHFCDFDMEEPADTRSLETVCSILQQCEVTRIAHKHPTS